MAECRKCDVELTEENWYPSNEKDNRRICNECMDEYYREYRKEHREEFREYSRRWKERHPESTEVRAKAQKRYAERNPKKIKAHNLIGNNPDKYPLDSKCEFCGSTENLEHGHLNYDYPEIYLTVCHGCNCWMGR